ncbi:hypothetical protein Agub_g14598, partial [Astrephomene gubernaculifera]
ASSQLREPQLPPLSSFMPGGGAGHSHPTWPYGNVVDPKFAAKDATWDSDRWVSAVSSYLAQEEQHRRALLAAAGPERGGAAVVAAARLLARPGSAMGAVLRRELLGSWEEAADTLHSSFHTAHPAEDCLVNTWVASGGGGSSKSGSPSSSPSVAGRWVLIDLTAGGKDWGPALGGEGVVHTHTLPNVHELFGAVKRIKEEVRQAALQPSPDGSQPASTHQEAAVVAELAAAKAARLPSVANRHHHMYLLKKHARMHGSGAPGSSPAPGADPSSPPISEEEAERQWRLQHQVVLLQAELDVIEEWALRYCHEQAHPPLACSGWREEAAALRAGLSKLHGAAGAEATYELFRQHRWEIFGQESEDWLHQRPDLYDEEEISRDTLLSELAGAMSRAIRHVIAPPTATWQPTASRLTHGSVHGAAGTPPLHAAAGAAAGSKHVSSLAAAAAGVDSDLDLESAGHYPHPHPHMHQHQHQQLPAFAYHVHFQIHLISDSSRQRRGSAAAAAFDVEAFKAEVDTLRMRNQAFKFSVHPAALHDQPALAAGLAAATRTALQEVPSGEDFFEAEMERVYVDSTELAATLRTLFPPTRQQQQREQQQAGRQGVALTSPSRDLPVYVFLLERDVPVLLDAHYNARELGDMVMVVANSARRDEPPTGMMCGGSLLPRPTSPLKEALAAVLGALGGLLPPHLGYDPRTHSISHDWLWSVGGHPLSFTSTGLHYAPLQRDALARSHLIDALDASVGAVNGAVGRLARVAASEHVWKHLKAHQAAAREIVRQYGQVVSYWRSAVATAYGLDLSSALEYLRALEGQLGALERAVGELAEQSEPLRCRSQVVGQPLLVRRLAPLSWGLSGLAALGALGWGAGLGPGVWRKKAKAS